MIAESVGTEKLEAMSRARWEARLASDRQALVRARKHLARVDDAAAAAGTTADRRDNDRRDSDALVVRLEDVPDARERETPNARSRRVDVDSDEDDANAVPEDVAGGRVESSGNADAFAGDSVALSPPPGEAGALLLATMPPPPGPAPGVRASDVDDARWAHHAWRMATSRVVNAVVAAAAASDWRLDDAATEGEDILDPDAKVSAAAREAARAAVAAVVDYDPEQFQDVVVKSGGNEPSTRDDAAANAAATTIQTGWRAGGAAAARRTEARRARRRRRCRRRGEGREREEKKRRGEGSRRGRGRRRRRERWRRRERRRRRRRERRRRRWRRRRRRRERWRRRRRGSSSSRPRLWRSNRLGADGASDAASLALARRRDSTTTTTTISPAWRKPSTRPPRTSISTTSTSTSISTWTRPRAWLRSRPHQRSERFSGTPRRLRLRRRQLLRLRRRRPHRPAEGKEWAHLLPRASAEDWPMSRLASSSAESRGGDDSEVGSSARAMERKLEEAASDWGLRERGPAAEAFYRNRAKLLKQEQRRKEREALKDPLKRVRRFHRVAAGTAAANAAGPGSAANAAASAARRKSDSGASGSSRTTTDAVRRGTAFEFVGSGSGSGSAFGSAFGSGSALLSRDFAADATTTRRRIVYTPPAMAETGSKTGRSSGRTRGGSAVRRERGRAERWGGDAAKALGGRRTELRARAPGRARRWSAGECHHTSSGRGVWYRSIRVYSPGRVSVDVQKSVLDVLIRAPRIAHPRERRLRRQPPRTAAFARRWI